MIKLSRSEIEEAQDLTNTLVKAATLGTDIGGGLCFHYTALGIEALKMMGFAAEAEAGNASWSVDYTINWFEFKWCGEAGMKERVINNDILDLALPEVHCWIRIEDYILDFSTKDLEKTLHFFGLDWEHNYDPPDYIYTDTLVGAKYMYEPIAEATEAIKRRIDLRNKFIEQMIGKPLLEEG